MIEIGLNGVSSTAVVQNAADVNLSTSCSSPDPHTLASMLQDRLDAINTEIRMIQDQKKHAERAAEQLEQQAWMTDLSGSIMPGSGGAGGILYGENAEGLIGQPIYSSQQLLNRTSPRNSPQYEFLMAKYNNVCKFTLDRKCGLFFKFFYSGILLMNIFKKNCFSDSYKSFNFRLWYASFIGTSRSVRILQYR